MGDQAFIAAAAEGSLSPVALASVLDQSVDCVKLIGLDGDVQYMNSNGLCAMEIDDFRMIAGKRWADLWPVESRDVILDSMVQAASGAPARFRAFCPTAKGAPRWWDVTVSAINDAAGTHAGFLSISRDVSENQSGREALEIAAAEMKHRLKNTYMMISSLLIGFARGDPVQEVYAKEMADRLIALSAAQALFVSDDASCDLATLIEALILPFDNPACRVTIDSQVRATLDQGQADAIALVVGELSVNSAKHGALMHGGEVHVDSRIDGGMLTIQWTERSLGPVDSAPRAGGQGLRLMERIMRNRRGTLDFAWQPDGLVATLNFDLA